MIKSIALGIAFSIISSIIWFFVFADSQFIKSLVPQNVGVSNALFIVYPTLFATALAMVIVFFVGAPLEKRTAFVLTTLALTLITWWIFGRGLTISNF